MRRLDAGDGGPCRQLRRPYLAPVRTAVGRHVHQAVIRSGPDDLIVHRRERDRRKRIELFLAGHIGADRSAGPPLLALVIAREIGADDLPVDALIEGLEHHVCADQQFLRVVRREYLWMVPPAKTVIDLVTPGTELPFGRRVDLSGDTRSPVLPHFLTVVPAAVRHPGLAG